MGWAISSSGESAKGDDNGRPGENEYGADEKINARPGMESEGGKKHDKEWIGDFEDGGP
jgi:hypothetical protein